MKTKKIGTGVHCRPRMRKLLNGSRVKELNAPTEWVFQSKCPDKWVHIDCEEGHIYVPGLLKEWKAPTTSQLKSAMIAIERELKNKKEGF
jgi:hypothetical protein